MEERKERRLLRLLRVRDKFPVPGSPLEEAIFYCWRTSNVPFTDRVIVPREHLNELISEVCRQHYELDRLKNK